MKNKASILLLLLFAFTAGKGQDFITRVKIKFEKKINLKAALRSQQAIDEELLEQFPKYDISYYSFLYAGNTSLYHFEKEGAKDEEGSQNFSMSHYQDAALFMNYGTGMATTKKSLFGEEHIIQDSIKAVKWRITQETRTIAGYECRKAIGRIHDSIYIVAFYCEQLVMKAGPEGIQGLPGMILGMAIPRYYTTWFATKVELANIDESKIVPPSKGKKLSKKELAAWLVKKYKEMGKKDITEEKVEGEMAIGYLL